MLQRAQDDMAAVVPLALSARVDEVMLGNDPGRPPALQELAETLPSSIQGMDLVALSDLCQTVIPRDRLPSDAFWNSLDRSQHADALRACLLVYTSSLGNIIPRDFQLQAVIASLSGRDGLVTAATGSGKTLIMIMLLMLRPSDTSILIVPLKRLQDSHISAFTSYGIPSVVINEDTPDDPALWKVCGKVFNSRSTHLALLENRRRRIHESHHHNGAARELRWTYV
jgi:hypothetical protein